jgi:NAD(P)-dependent dehydrogenase (short-subunit alcohol dehydrogenase family)
VSGRLPDVPGPGVAIVTGAAHGIGLAVAQQLGDRGLSVAVVDPDESALSAAPLAAGTMRIAADIAEDPSEWVASVRDHLGVPTVLVNNAAHEGDRSFLELPLDAVRRSLDVTLFGTWAVTRSVVDLMIQAKQPGSVIFNLSLHARRVRFCPDYSVGKAGLLMLMKELANELGPHGVRVNAVSPGAIDTWSDRIPDGDAHRSRTEELVPLRRVGHPDEVSSTRFVRLPSSPPGPVNDTPSERA